MPPDDSVIPAAITPEEFHARGFEAILAVAPDDVYTDMWTMLRTAAGGFGSARMLRLQVVSGEGHIEGGGAAQIDEPAPAAYGV